MDAPNSSSASPPRRDGVAPACVLMLTLQLWVTRAAVGNEEQLFDRWGLKLPALAVLLIEGSKGLLTGWFVLAPAALVAAAWLWWRPHPHRSWINGALIVAFFLGWMLGLLGLAMPMVEWIAKLIEPVR